MNSVFDATDVRGTLAINRLNLYNAPSAHAYLNLRARCKAERE